MLTKTKIAFKIRLYSIQASILLKVDKAKDDFVTFGKVDKLTKRNLLALKNKNLILLRKDKDFWKVKITKDGLLEVLKLHMVESDELPANEVCLLVFDIPEKFKKQRDLLSKFLTECCFIRIQKSVWQTRFDCSDLVFAFLTSLGVIDWVRIFSAKEK